MVCSRSKLLRLNELWSVHEVSCCVTEYYVHWSILCSREMTTTWATRRWLTASWTMRETPLCHHKGYVYITTLSFFHNIFAAKLVLVGEGVGYRSWLVFVLVILAWSPWGRGSPYLCIGSSWFKVDRTPFPLNRCLWKHKQGGHGTGKTGNLVLTFSRQGKHREFCCNTGKVFETQGKYFWLYLLMQKACFSLHIFKIF